MPCNKASITKTYKCDKDGCICIPTNGAARVCLSVNETDSIVRCDCECDTKCECNETCTCINTAGMTCICVCRDQNGRIKTCEDCSCQPKQAQTQTCKGSSNVTCCCNTGNQKCACLNCACSEPGKNKCEKGSCVTSKGEKAVGGCQGESTCACKSKQVDGSLNRTRQSTNCSGNCDEKCKCSSVEQDDAFKANVCAGKACSGNCKCQGNANSCVCICKNKQGETVCCDDCKCDRNTTCDKKGCICIRKESSCKCELVETSCCGSCDAKCKCSGRKQEATSKAKNFSTCRANCKCQENTNSCVCICKDEEGKNVCCDDCKCDGNNRCDKEGCVCIRKEPTSESVKTNGCVSCDAKGKCSCVEQNTAIKANNCAGKTCGENCKCQGNGNSCVCICKNKQGETVCCDDCKCDSTNICDKKGCVCVPKEGSCKGQPLKPNCCENYDAKCKCSCVSQGAVFNANSCAGKVCAENCKCQGNGNSCVCICKNNQGQSICCDDCKCEGDNACDKKGCVCVPRGTMTCNKTITCKTDCCCRNAVGSCVCICKNKQGETVCCDDCKCDSTNICDKKGCVCVPKEDSCKGQPIKPNCCENCQGAVFNANSCAGKVSIRNCKCQGNGKSCVCICMNKQGESICCDDCKCDNNNICDKKGCVCIRKESSCKRKPVKTSCCQNCNENCKCSCVDHERMKINNCSGMTCVGNCNCQRNTNYKCLGKANSCVCICKNKQGETICCEDCKCDDNNRCEKKECTCIPTASVTLSLCHKNGQPKCCC